MSHLLGYITVCKESFSVSIKALTMPLVLVCPIVLVLPNEKLVLGAVVVEPNGLKRLPAGCWAG